MATHRHNRPHLLRRAAIGALALSLTVGLSTLAPSAHAAPGDIGGTVFRDYNLNGAFDVVDNTPATAHAGDVGVPGASVSVFGSNGSLLAPVQQTGSSGAFAFSGLSDPSGEVRVEVAPPAPYVPGSHGAGSGTTVQYVPLGTTTVGVALSMPGDYSTTAPAVLNAISSTALAGLTFTSQTTAPSLLSSAYAARGAKTGTSPVMRATAAQTGSIWGLAQLDARWAFTSALLKRHARVGPGEPGLGVDNHPLGEIYLTDLNNATANAGAWKQISTPGDDPRGVETATDPVEYSTTQADWFHDVASYQYIGKRGLGGLALAPDEKSLYVINLNTRSMWQVSLHRLADGTPVADALTEIQLPLGTTAAAPARATTFCAGPDTNLRPFGVSSANGALWVTLTCTGTSVAALRGYVYKYSLDGTGFGAPPAPVAEFGLGGYTRGATLNGSAGPADWQPWNDDPTLFPAKIGSGASQPQPLVSDVAFDSNGDMSIAIKDRFGDQVGPANGKPDQSIPNTTFTTEGYPAGDVLRACRVGATFVVESNGACPGRTAAAQPNTYAYGGGMGDGEGPGGGEFYSDNYANLHHQTSLGAVLQVPGFGQLIPTAFDPGTANVEVQGYRFNDNLNGTVSDNPNGEGFHELTASGDAGSFRKGGGLGDMQALIGIAPIEIGSRLWKDVNGNGIHDAGEPPLAGVTVHLYAANGTTQLGEAVTGADGSYYFSSGPGPVATPTNQVYNIAGLTPSTPVVVSVDKATDYDPGHPLAGLFATPAGQGNDPLVDSNGIQTDATHDRLTVTTGGPGVDNFSLGLGFSVPYAVGGTDVFIDTNRNGVRDPGEPAAAGIRVRLTDPAGHPVTHADGTPVLPVTTNAAGHYVFDLLRPGAYRVIFEHLPPGYGFTTPHVGSNPALDSDPDPATGIATVTLGPVGPGLPNMRVTSPADGLAAVAIDATIDAGLLRRLPPPFNHHRPHGPGYPCVPGDYDPACDSGHHDDGGHHRHHHHGDDGDHHKRGRHQSCADRRDHHRDCSHHHPNNRASTCAVNEPGRPQGC